MDRRFTLAMVAAALVSLAAWMILRVVAPKPSIPWTDAMVDASHRMRRGIDVIAATCERRGIAIDASVDPNGTCLIGPDLTPLFTTLGQLEAKRTTTNPDVAALLVHLLDRAGVSRGDRVAVGASGSFPALLIAVQTAVEAIGAHPVIVLSLGASSYGATRPDFHLLDLSELLVREGVVSTPAAAVSLGGEGDAGSEFGEELTRELVRQVEARGVPLIREPDFRANVARRMALYSGDGASNVAAFVNVGGADANIGTSPLVLEVEPGLHTDVPLPPPSQRGVLFEMASRGVPVIHLLHVRGLAQQHGLPWDPVPLPAAGETRLLAGDVTRSWVAWLVAGAYLAILGAIAAVTRRGRPTSTGTPARP